MALLSIFITKDDDDDDDINVYLILTEVPNNAHLDHVGTGI